MQDSVTCDRCGEQEDVLLVVKDFFDYYKHGAAVVDRLWCLRCVRGVSSDED
jgi:hypothetical protein